MSKRAVHIIVPVEGRPAVPCGMENRDSLTTRDPLEVTCPGCRECLTNLERAAAYRRRHNLPAVKA